MCKQVSFPTAVLLTVQDKIRGQSTFSIYDITSSLRQSVNSGDIAFNDKTPEDVNGNTTYRVEHEDVRAIFDELYHVGALGLDRKSNGRYFEYFSSSSPVGGSAPSNTVPTIVATNSSAAVQAAVQGLSTATLKAANNVASLSTSLSKHTPNSNDFNSKLVEYLNGRGVGSVVTMKEVQSRFDNMKGTSCATFGTLVSKAGYRVDMTNKYPSKWTVTV